MSYLFDSSAIFTAVTRNVIEILPENYTIELVRYELGNILWKEHVLQRRIGDKEVEELIKLIRDVLKLMKILSIECYEDVIIDLAGKLGLTFYDASYVFYTRKMDLTLVTEDEKLMSKAKPHVKVLKLNGITPR